MFTSIQDYGTCTINKDFVAARLDPAIAREMIQLATNNNITQETLLRALQEGEWMPEGFDVQLELEATAQDRARALAERQAQLDASLGGLP